MFHFIFDYNLGNSRQILIIFASLETEMNILPSRYKLFHFNLIMFSLYLIKIKKQHKNSQLFYFSIQLNRLFQNFTESRSMFVSFRICQKFLQQSSSKIFLHSRWFHKKISSNSILLILTCKLKLKSHEIRRVTVMTSSSQ